MTGKRRLCMYFQRDFLEIVVAGYILAAINKIKNRQDICK